MKYDPLMILLVRLVNLRDAGRPCISCGRTYAKMDVGHYYGKGAYPNLKYDEMNVHLQCRRCNMQSNVQGYQRGLLERYGQDFLDILERKSRACLRMRKAQKEDLLIYLNGKIKELERASA